MRLSSKWVPVFWATIALGFALMSDVCLNSHLIILGVFFSFFAAYSTVCFFITTNRVL